MTPLEVIQSIEKNAPHWLTPEDRRILRLHRAAPLVRWGGVIGPVLCAVALIAMIWRIK